MDFLASLSIIKRWTAMAVLLVFGTSFGARAQDLSTTHVVILVPGFFNSLAPGNAENGEPYFSEDVVNVFEQAGFHTYVVDNLDPTGGLKENTGLLSDYLNEVMEDEPDMKMILVAHSAGGLYSLNLLNQSPNAFPVDEVMTLATPFLGINFMQYILDGGVIARDALRDLDLKSLLEFTIGNMQNVLSGWHLSSSLKVHIFYGYQDSHDMTPPLKITQALNGVRSDGIVPVRSALGLAGAQVTEHSSDFIHLEHWEQVLDARLFEIFHADVAAIRAEQIRFYQVILNAF